MTVSLCMLRTRYIVVSLEILTQHLASHSSCRYVLRQGGSTTSVDFLGSLNAARQVEIRSRLDNEAVDRSADT